MSKRYGGVEGDLDGPAFSKKEIRMISSFKTTVNPSHVSEMRRNAKNVTEDNKEICSKCHKKTDVDFDTPVWARTSGIFTDCGGQLCSECNLEVYGPY